MMLKIAFVKTNRIANACLSFLNIDAAGLQILPSVGITLFFKYLSTKIIWHSWS